MPKSRKNGWSNKSNGPGFSSVACLMKNIRSDLDRTYWNTLHRNKEIRTAIRKMLKTYKADYLITINFNRATNFDAAKKILKELQARINRKLFGKWWLRKPVSERTEFVAFVERTGPPS